MKSQRQRIKPNCLILAAMLALCLPAGAETLHGKIADRAGFADSESGQPIGGAKITLYNQAGKRIAVKTSNRSGGYRIPKLAPGTYTLALERKGYSPAPALHILSIGNEDTLSRDFLLDRVPIRNGLVLKSEASKKKPAPKGYYARLAEGILASGRIETFHRDASENKISLSRFFDADDTTSAYRQLWLNLTWAEIESQNRPLPSLVYLAHALDSAIRTSGLEAAPSMKPWLKVSDDSMEAFVLALHRMILAPAKKDPYAYLAGCRIPREMQIECIKSEMESPAIPKTKRKAFLVKARNVLGPTVTGPLLAKIEGKKARRQADKKSPAKSGPPEPDNRALWKVVQELGGGKQPNPVAFFHLAWRNFESGHFSEALERLTRFASMRPDYPHAVEISALAHLALKDTAAASSAYESLTKAESPEWQAIGFQSLARLQWAQGQAEKAEANLWAALGLDSKSPEARHSLLLLAEISLQRDSWNSVEERLETLVQQRPREAEAHYWLGKMALKRDQDGVALDHFRKACTLEPHRLEFAVATAQAYFTREEYASALKILKPMSARLNGEGLYITGQCLLLSNHAKEAINHFERLYSAQPTAQNLVPLAKALAGSGQGKQAINLIEGSPFTRDFQIRKTLAEAKLNQDAPDEALQLLGPLLSEKETDAELHFLAGKCALAKRDYTKASKEFTSALQYQEDYPVVKYQLGVCLLKLGRAGEAHHYFLELMDMEKPAWRAKGLMGQGQAFAKENKLEAAIVNLQKSFQTAATAEAAANLATTYMRLDNTEEASHWADQALRLDAAEPLGLMVKVDVLFAQHQDDQAVAMAKSGLIKWPESCDFMIVGAKAYLRAGKDEEAKNLSLKASTRCPEEAAPYYFLGTLAGKSGTEDEARKHFAEYRRSGGDAKRVPAAYR